MKWTLPIHSHSSGSSAAYYVCYELSPLLNSSELSIEYVQVKPILAAVTLVLKATGKYGDGDFRSDKGYLYVTVVYNISICVALYSLAMFWVVINDDVKPFRPVPKFLCIKGTWSFSPMMISRLIPVCRYSVFLFLARNGHFSPRQSRSHYPRYALTLYSWTLAHIFTVGPYTDSEHIALAISDTLICFEMPCFAIAHMFAFSHTDYIDKGIQYAARMPFFYAVRDAFGLLDVLEDSRATFHGGVSYRTFEPAEGGIHVGSGRNRRIRAGLRYAKGGKQKYWLPLPQEADSAAVATAPPQAARQHWAQYRPYASLVAEQAEDAVHEGPSYRQSQYRNDDSAFTPDYTADDDDNLSLNFGSPQEDEDRMYDESRKLLFGDYNYPVIDVSSEAARKLMWDEEERILTDERAAAWAWKGGRATAAYSGTKGYGATDIESQNPLLRKPDATTRAHPAIIDYDNERVPDTDVHGVRLQWTKVGTAVPRASSSQKPSFRSKRDPIPGYVSDPATPSNERIPKGAVDLAMEDPDAVIQEMEQERRNGELSGDDTNPWA